MSRVKDALLGGQGYSQNRHAPMLDLKHGGQNGHMTDFATHVSNAAYVKRNLICKLVTAPRGFRDLESSEKWVDTLQALVELHAKSIEGLQSTLTVEWAENAVGGAGQMQEDLINVTEARSTPTFVWTEKYGKPINAFLEGWIVNLLMDPITKYPRVLTEAGTPPTDLLPDYTGASMIFIEPDPTHTHVVKAWLCTNMHPKTGGEVTGRRDLTAAGETLDYSVEFTALTQTGRGVDDLAQQFLDEMSLTGVNPNTRPAFLEGISEDVKSAASGYADQIAAAAASAI